MRRRGGSNDQTAGGAKLSKSRGADYRFGKFVAYALAMCTGVSSATFAADLSAPAPSPVYKEAPVAYNWTGLYIGGNIGGAWSGLSGSNFSDTIGSTFSGATNLQFMGGGQVGVNYQFWNGIVIGAEAMFDWLPSNQNLPITAVDPTGTVAANIAVGDARWLTTAAGRLGYAWDRVLFYAKGGGAWVATNSPTIAVGGPAASFASVNNSNSFGYTAGFGLEWAFWNNWSLRTEYDYIGLPSQSLTVAAGTPTFGGDVLNFRDRNISIMTLAVNYKFGGW
jgi:outer membrane immunogenic protein